MRIIKSNVGLVAMDTAAVCCSAGLAVAWGENGYAEWWRYALSACLYAAAVIGCMGAMKLYSRVWAYAGYGEWLAIGKSVLAGSLIAYAAESLLMQRFGDAGALLLHVESMLLLIGVSRVVRKIRANRKERRVPYRSRAVIVGAGGCGVMVANELLHSGKSEILPVAFIDDDPGKQDRWISGIPVLGGRESIGEAVERMKADEIILALPSVSRKEIKELAEICQQSGAKTKIVPSLNGLIHGKVDVKELRDIDVEDLLGREPVVVDLREIAAYVSSRTVLVTGAGGSIGSELCRQLAALKPELLLLLGHGENSIYTIEMELRDRYPDQSIVPIIADIQDRERIDAIFAQYRPHVVFHAAAHKHVPLMEANPSEAIKNNILGTKNMADNADKYGAERFVLISSDKAVNPTSVMGTTKRISEMYIQSLSLSKLTRTKFAAVRFGNVLGSRGSVIPRFKEQIARGGPVTITHPDMIRYFMTIPEAVQLVIQAGAFSNGGEVFVLDMGKPVRIMDLASDLIRLSGLRPGEDVEITCTGIRPGEKLYEELLTSEEGLSSTKHDRIFIGQPAAINRVELEFEIKKLEKLQTEDKDTIKKVLQHIVPNYGQPAASRSAPEYVLVQ